MGAQLTHHMMDSLEGSLNSIVDAATQTADEGVPLIELADSIAVSVDTVVKQQQEIKCLTAQVKILKKKGPQ